MDTSKLCLNCGKPVDPAWKICPACGAKVPLSRQCPGCKKQLEPGWKSCPYCGMTIVESIGPSLSIKDSVVKELHQIQQTDIHEAKGATVGGSININVGSDANGTRSSGSPEYQYEQYVITVLQSGGSLERARAQLEQRRSHLGLSLKQSQEIENLCLVKINRDISPPQNTAETHKHNLDVNTTLGKSNVKTSGRKKLTWIVAGSVVLVSIIVAIILINLKPSSPSLPIQAYVPSSSNTVPTVTQQASVTNRPEQSPQILPTQNSMSQNNPPQTITKYTFNAGVIPVGGGSISPSNGIYESGNKITILATPVQGFQFVSWSGDASGNNPSLSITIDSNKNVVANFAPILYSLSTSVNPPGSGNINPSSGSFNYGKQVILTATPASGYQFSSWSGDTNATNPNITLDMNSNKNIVANFALMPVYGPLKVAFNGWLVNNQNVVSASKSNQITVGITISGGNPGQYILQVRRDVSLDFDEIVTSTSFSYNNIPTTKQLVFIPPYATGDASTSGYYVELYYNGNSIWSIDGYPPRLRVTK